MSASQQTNNDANSCEQTPKSCDPSMAIPLHYSPIGAEITSSLCSGHDGSPKDVLAGDESLSMGTLSVISGHDGATGLTWHNKSKGLLLRKAAVAYYGIAEAAIAQRKYEETLALCQQALYCYSKYMHKVYLCD